MEIEYNRRTNCINCGAVLHGTQCAYCGTEYHLDDLGRIKEYFVKLEIFGQKMEFYVNSIEVRNDNYEEFRNLSGVVGRIKTGLPTMELCLTSTGRIIEED